MARYLALTCEALSRNIYASAADSPHAISIELFKQGLHDTPKKLRKILQEQIDAVDPGLYDAILLVYGVCGASTVELKAPQIPLVIPRAHDCITLYLGTKELYQEEFNNNPGTYWFSVDYMEHAEPGKSGGLGSVGVEDLDKQYEEFVEKYGKDSADMLIEEMRRWSAHYSRAVFIDTGRGDVATYEKKARDKAEKENWTFERKQGNSRLIQMLIHGDWQDDEILVVPPGQTIQQSYDEMVIKAGPSTEE